MVKFGVDDDMCYEDDQDNTSKQEPLCEAPIDDEPDDTFEFKVSRNRIPGGYDDGIRMSREHKTPAHVRTESTPGHLSFHGEASDHEASMAEFDNGSATSMEEDHSASQIWDSTSIPSNTLLPSKMCTPCRTESSFIENIPEEVVSSLEWSSQMRSSTGARFRMLDGSTAHTRQHMMRRHGSKAVKVSSTYAIHELDADLFAIQTNHSNLLKNFSTNPLVKSRNLRHHRFLFRWNHGTLIHSVQNVRQLALTSPFFTKFTSMGEQGLRHQLSLTTTSLCNGLPHNHPLPTAEAASMIYQGMDRRDRRLWQLVSLLFDPLQLSEHGESRIQDLRAIERRIREDKFGVWLRDSVIDAARIDESRAVSASEKIFVKLTGNQIEEACATALSVGDFRLATLLPLAGADKTIREDLRQQMQFWSTKDHKPFLDVSYRVIYEILSGNVMVSRGTGNSQDGSAADDIHIARDLDWKRALGLHYWYDPAEQNRISEALTSYDKATATKLSVVLPHNLSKTNESSRPICKIFDLDYCLLKLYSNQDPPEDTLFDPLAIRQEPFDYRNSWMLYIYLCKVRNLIAISRAHAEDANFFDSLSMNFAAQLEYGGQWEWAVFVMLSIENAVMRESQLRSILARKCSFMNAQLEDFFVEKLRIPRSWATEAKILLARNQGSYAEEARLLMSIESWVEAHRTVLTHIAPQAIISGNLMPLHSLLSAFRGIAAIDNWMQGGQIYLDAIKLIQCERSHNLHQQGSRGATEIVLRLANSLPKLSRTSFEQRVAQKEIAALVVRVLLTAQEPEQDCLLSCSDLFAQRGPVLNYLTCYTFYTLLSKA